MIAASAYSGSWSTNRKMRRRVCCLFCAVFSMLLQASSQSHFHPIAVRHPLGSYCADRSTKGKHLPSMDGKDLSLSEIIAVDFSNPPVLWRRLLDESYPCAVDMRLSKELHEDHPPSPPKFPEEMALKRKLQMCPLEKQVLFSSFSLFQGIIILAHLSADHFNCGRHTRNIIVAVFAGFVDQAISSFHSIISAIPLTQPHLRPGRFSLDHQAADVPQGRDSSSSSSPIPGTCSQIPILRAEDEP